MDIINVVLADDHVLVRDGIKALLEDQTGILVIDEASNGKEALDVISRNKPHVLIVDIQTHPLYLMKSIDIIPDLIPEEHIFNSFKECTSWIIKNLD